MENLENYTIEELKKMQKDIEKILEKQSNRRKNELWDKVIEAVDAYQKEIEDITFFSYRNTYSKLELSDPGLVDFAYED